MVRAAQSEECQKLSGRQEFADFLKISVDTLEARARLVDPRLFGITVNGRWEGFSAQAADWDRVARFEKDRHPEMRKLSPWQRCCPFYRPAEPPSVAEIHGRVSKTPSRGNVTGKQPESDPNTTGT